MKFNTLSLEAVVVHKVPAKGDPPDGPVLSEARSPKDTNVFSFFRQRMSGVMATRGLPIQPDRQGINDKAERGEVLAAVRKIIDDEGKLVAASQDIARRLYAAQDRRNPAGILVVARGSVDAQPCVGLLKLEHEKGVQAEEGQDENGQLVFRVILHDDLLLTENTAVFKSAVFRRRSATSATLVAEASDLQNPRDLAGFFLTSFLGCRLIDDPPEATRKFFDAAEDYINKRVSDPEHRAKYEGALLAHMNSSAQTVDPDRFARDHLTSAEHRPFLDHLKQAGASATAFPKDNERIKPRLRRVAYGFESGIKLVGSPEAMEEHVEIEDSTDGGTEVTITDEITRVRGGG